MQIVGDRCHRSWKSMSLHHSARLRRSNPVSQEFHWIQALACQHIKHLTIFSNFSFTNSHFPWPRHQTDAVSECACWLMFIFGRGLAANQTPQAQVENWLESGKLFSTVKPLEKYSICSCTFLPSLPVCVCHVLIAKNKMRKSRAFDACATLWFLAYCVYCRKSFPHALEQ